MTSKTYTVLLGAAVLCAWGSIGEIVKAALRREPVDSTFWAVLGVAALVSAAIWLYYRMKRTRLEIKSFVGSIPLGSGLLCLYVLSFVAPGVLARGADIFDLIFTALVVAAVVALALYYLRKNYFTPPDSPEGLDSSS